jgi:hypothetical protein
MRGYTVAGMDAERLALAAVMLVFVGCASRPAHDYKSPLHMIKDSDRWTEGRWQEREPIEPTRTIKAVGQPGKVACKTGCGCFEW